MIDSTLMTNLADAMEAAIDGHTLQGDFETLRKVLRTYQRALQERAKDRRIPYHDFDASKEACYTEARTLGGV